MKNVLENKSGYSWVEQMLGVQKEIEMDHFLMKSELDHYGQIHKDYLSKGLNYVKLRYSGSQYLTKYLKGIHLELKENYLAHKQFKEAYDCKVELCMMFMPKDLVKELD